MAKIRLSRKAIADLDSIWDYTVETWSKEQARQIYTTIQGLNSLPAFLEKDYYVIKTGFLGFKFGHHIVFYKRHKDGSILVDRILHEKMDYQRHVK